MTDGDACVRCLVRSLAADDQRGLEAVRAEHLTAESVNTAARCELPKERAKSWIADRPAFTEPGFFFVPRTANFGDHR